jgi:hypothetical protein
VLETFFNSLLGGLPWWDQAWQVADVGPARHSSSSLALSPEKVQVVEVTVPGFLSRGTHEAQPFSARVRLLEDRLLRWQMKVGDMVVGPALAPVGEPEPHPFGAVVRLLMESRGVPLAEVAHQTGRSMSTIRKLQDGRLVAERRLVDKLARALDLPAADLAVIAGLDPADPGWG